MWMILVAALALAVLMGAFVLEAFLSPREDDIDLPLPPKVSDPK